MTPGLRALARSAHGSAAAVDKFIAGNEFPLVGEDGVTFVYRGPAEAVYVKIWAYGLPSSLPMEPVGRTDLCAVTLPLPPNSRVEYKLDVVRDGHGSLITDPLNPLTAPDPFGANSVVCSAGYARPEWSMFDDAVSGGVIDELPIDCSSRNGRVPVYIPARFKRSRQYPLLVMHDGLDFVNFGDFKVVLDNLMSRLDIPDMIVAMDVPTDRNLEYAAAESHAQYLTETLLPALTSAFPLIDAPQSRGLAGASLGAVASLHAACRRPHVWGRLGLLSGSFVFDDGERTLEQYGAFAAVGQFVSAFRLHPRAMSDSVYMSCGVYESLIRENRALLPVLSELPMEVRYREHQDGHNWENWRDRMRECLSFLYPGPSWFVYF
jgi:enterochelin esterase-like enzyme